MHKICFVIMLDDSTHNYVRELEMQMFDKYGISAAMCQDPHITIKYPFDTDDLDGFTTYLEELASTMEPIEIELVGISGFEPTVLFVGVKENPKLYELHHRIITDLKQKFNLDPDQFDEPNIKFHVNFAVSDVTPNVYFDGIVKMKQANPYLKFKFKHLGLFYYIGNQRGWITHKRFLLTKNK